MLRGRGDPSRSAPTTSSPARLVYLATAVCAIAATVSGAGPATGVPCAFFTAWRFATTCWLAVFFGAIAGFAFLAAACPICCFSSQTTL
jgi:hypothetical protein